MRLVIMAAAATLMLTADTNAASRYTVSGMTCERAQALVQRHGEVIFNYRSASNPANMLYDRFVADGSRCAGMQYAAPAFIPTSNNPQCAVLRCADLMGGRSRGGGGGGGSLNGAR